MKRLLALFLCLTMLFALAACGDKKPEGAESPSTTESTPSETTPSESTPGESVPDDTEPAEDAIRENGQLPADEDDLTKAEINYYAGSVIQAIIDLDLETLEKYACEDNINAVKAVKNNDAYRDMWEKTVGQSVYLKDSRILVYKDPTYVFAQWITDAAKTGETLKGKLEEYTIEEFQAMYAKYGTNTPYIARTVDISDDVEIDIEDGKIVIDANEAFSCSAWDELYDISAPTFQYKGCDEQMAHMLFGENAEVSLGLDYISDGGKFTIWEAMLTGDLKQITTAFDAATGYDLNAEITDTTNMLYEAVYQGIYKNADESAKLQAWMDENVTIARDISTLYVYIPAEMEKTYPYYTIQDSEKSLLDGKEIFIRADVFRHRAGSESEFDAFYELAAQAARFDKIKWISEGGPA